MRYFLTVLRVLKKSSLALTLLAIIAMTAVVTLDLGVLNSVLSLYDKMVYAGEEDSITVGGYSVAPFTSLVRVRDVEELVEGLEGVRSASYEVLTVGLINGNPLVIRGVNFSAVRELVGYKVVEGSKPSENCYSCLWLGIEAYKKLGVSVGRVVAVKPVFSRETVFLKVAGVLDVRAPYRYEALVAYELGQALRGVSGDVASLVRITYNSSEIEASEIYEKLGVKVPQSLVVHLLERAFLALKYLPEGRVQLLAYEAPTGLYTARLGLNKNVLFLANLALGVVISYGFYVVGASTVSLNRDRVVVLYEQGLSMKKIKLSIALLLVLSVTISYAVLSSIIPALWTLSSTLDLLGYRVELYVDPLSEAVVVLAASTLTSVGVYRAKVEDVDFED